MNNENPNKIILKGGEILVNTQIENDLIDLSFSYNGHNLAGIALSPESAVKLAANLLELAREIERKRKNERGN